MIINLQHNFTTIIDDEDYHLIREYHWYAAEGVSTFYVQAGVYKDGVAMDLVRMHRVILGVPDGYQVDHRNGNGLDNRRVNIRVCTHQQNMCNKKIPICNTSGYKGVYFASHINKFIARIGYKNKRIHLGCFNTAIEASIVYENKARELFGDFYREV
jgi:hypothetical protein